MALPYALDVFVNRYQVVGQLEARTALHIGAGGEGSLDPRRPDNGVVLDARTGCPYIPGSSLKGACRAFLARVLRAKDPPLACKGICAGDGLQELCPTCRLFGTQRFASRVFFADAPALTWDRRAALERRTHVGIDPDVGTQRRGRLFDLDVVPAGHRFAAEWYADNVDEEDRRHLHMLRAALEEGLITIGAGASRGLGLIRLVAAAEACDDLESLSRLIGAPPSVGRTRFVEMLAAHASDRLTWDDIRQAYARAAEEMS